MLRAVVAICVLGLAVSSPAVTRTREEIEAFRTFLEGTQIGNNQYVTRGVLASNHANAEEMSGRYEGDIVLDGWMIEEMVQEYAQGRNAYIRANTKWPNNTIVYEFQEGEFDALQTAAIRSGMAEIESKTCIRFRPRQSGETVYTRLTGNPDGCYASVGYWQSRGIHNFNLARNTPGVGCFRHVTIIHEWMHIIGFLHMQATYDRDNYVRIAGENIQAGMEHNFDIQPSNMVSNLGIDYDYVSCLHYSAYAFSINGLPTIVALRQFEGQMGQRDFVTDKDWLRINRHYNCPGAWN